MDERQDHAASELLLLMADFGQAVSQAMTVVAGTPELVGNTPILVLSSLDLHGPQRPSALQALTGLSSGGVSKLLDGMEAHGVVRRDRRTVDGDRRAVLVSLTTRGNELLRALTNELEARLPEAETLVREMIALLDRLASGPRNEPARRRS
jgi:DNA-binding MarR family transcriptional regulator